MIVKVSKRGQIKKSKANVKVQQSCDLTRRYREGLKVGNGRSEEKKTSITAFQRATLYPPSIFFWYGYSLPPTSPHSLTLANVKMKVVNSWALSHLDRFCSFSMCCTPQVLRVLFVMKLYLPLSTLYLNTIQALHRRRKLGVGRLSALLVKIYAQVMQHVKTIALTPSNCVQLRNMLNKILQKTCEQ